MIKTEIRNSLKRRRSFKKTATLLNSAMLIIHILFLISFYFLKVKELFYFNIFSIVFYTLNFIIINGYFAKTFLILLVGEIWGHLYAATIYCGWDFGFSLYPFAILSVIFYTQHIYYKGRFSKIFQISVSASSIVLFLFLRIITYIYEPVYTFNPLVGKVSFCLNATIVFFFMIVFLFFYINNVIRSERSLQELADFDELTNLYNRHKMRDILTKVYENSRDDVQKNFCTAIVDIDDFKEINDTYGHDAGDFILKKASSMMRQICKESQNAYIGRWGGEEFLVVQEYAREENEGVVPCINTIKRIHDSIKNFDFTYHGKKISITVTIGIASKQKNASIAETICLADERLYKGKLNGKDCISFS